MKRVILTHSPSAQGTIRRFFREILPSKKPCVIASFDDYSHGPLLSSGTSTDFFVERQAFWRSLDLYDVDIVHQFDLSDEHAALVKEIQTAMHVEIWTTNSVQEVFFAAVLMHLLRLDGIDPSNILIRDFSGQNVSWGLGSVRVEELAAIYESSEAVPIDTKFYSDAWIAISHGSGEAVKAFLCGLNESTSLAKSLSAYLLRFPVFNGGLGSIDRALLGAGTAKMKKSAYTVGTAMALGGAENDLVGDFILFRRLVELSRMTPDPWFEVEGDPHHMRSCSARLTESGKEARTRYAVQVL